MGVVETWKQIPGFDGRYEVSNLGGVRSYANARHGNRISCRSMALKTIPVGYL